MTRFFISPEEMHGNILNLTGENAAHAKVLRLKEDEQVIVCDGQGNECLCTVTDISSGHFCLTVNGRYKSTAEPSVHVSVYMAFSKGDKFEHVIQKATELGAAEIIAFPSARCVSKPDDKSLMRKLERWQKIASAASEQSGRGCIPAVIALDSYQSAIDRAAKSDIGILFYENEASVTLQMVLHEKKYSSISIVSGPEGGLEPSEVDRATEAGLKVCTLGKRILRCETAPLCALSAIMFDSGEF